MENKQQIPISKKYKKLQIVGNGTFGCVYLAKNMANTNEQNVAIKHVHQNKKYKNRELQILKLIKHQNIIQLYEHFYEDLNEVLAMPIQNTFLNLIMEYLPYTLSSIIKDNLYCKSFIKNDLIIKYSFGLLKALHYLELKGIAHRDIKPSNILLNDNGDAKLCDFGSAKILVTGQKNISYIVSRYYRSPELIFGAIDYSTAIDVWSLGCCICEMMINKPMFDGANNNTLLLKIIRTIGEPSMEDMEAMKVQTKVIQKIQASGIRQRIVKINADAPQQIIELVKKMLVYNPKKRIKPEQALKLPIFKHLFEQKLIKNQ